MNGGASLIVLLLAAGAACDNKSSGPAGSPAPPATATPATATATATATTTDPFDAILDGGNAIVRDDEELTIDGAKETWRLEWVRPPVPNCIGSGWETCPCAGFAFGEKGDMDLVRPAHGGQPEERLRLDRFFEGSDTKMARWPVTKADSAKNPEPMDIVMRPVSSVIKFADYDHDGRATELQLQVGAGPCGHTPTIVVGISKSSGKLHAFTSVEKPNEPLVLERAADWGALAKKSSVDLVQTACGDHGATESTTLHVVADGQLHVRTETKKCP